MLGTNGATASKDVEQPAPSRGCRCRLRRIEKFITHHLKNADRLVERMREVLDTTFLVVTLLYTVAASLPGSTSYDDLVEAEDRAHLKIAEWGLKEEETYSKQFVHNAMQAFAFLHIALMITLLLVIGMSFVPLNKPRLVLAAYLPALIVDLILLSLAIEYLTEAISGLFYIISLDSGVFEDSRRFDSMRRMQWFGLFPFAVVVGWACTRSIAKERERRRKPPLIDEADDSDVEQATAKMAELHEQLAQLHSRLGESARHASMAHSRRFSAWSMANHELTGNSNTLASRSEEV